MKACNIDETDLILDAINNNQIVAIPTDTIYGLATNIYSAEKIKIIKKRDNKPLGILCSSFKEMCEIIKIDSKYHHVLNKYIPGGVTIVGETLQEQYAINDGFSTTGVRVPNHQSLLKLLKETGPLVVSSANISGENETYCMNEVYNIFGESINLYVDNNEVASKTASTVININTLDIYRSSSITEQIINELKNI